MTIFRRLKCLFGQHDYYTHQEFSDVTRRVACIWCNKSWAVHEKLNIATPWNDEFEAFYEGRGVEIKPRHEQASSD